MDLEWDRAGVIRMTASMEERPGYGSHEQLRDEHPNRATTQGGTVMDRFPSPADPSTRATDEDLDVPGFLARAAQIVAQTGPGAEAFPAVGELMR